jgi:hypothetical protein
VNSTSFAIFLGEKAKFSISEKLKKQLPMQWSWFLVKKTISNFGGQSTIHKFSRNSTLKHCFFFPKVNWQANHYIITLCEHNKFIPLLLKKSYSWFIIKVKCQNLW